MGRSANRGNIEASEYIGGRYSRPNEMISKQFLGSFVGLRARTPSSPLIARKGETEDTNPILQKFDTGSNTQAINQQRNKKQYQAAFFPVILEQTKEYC